MVRKIMRYLFSPLVFFMSFLLTIIPFPFGILLFVMEGIKIPFTDDIDYAVMFSFILFPISNTFNFIKTGEIC